MAHESQLQDVWENVTSASVPKRAITVLAIPWKDRRRKVGINYGKAAHKRTHAQLSQEKARQCSRGVMEDEEEGELAAGILGQRMAHVRRDVYVCGVEDDSPVAVAFENCYGAKTVTVGRIQDEFSCAAGCGEWFDDTAGRVSCLLVDVGIQDEYSLAVQQDLRNEIMVQVWVSCYPV
ncbi:hypothetical protein BDW22DRAFT_1344788 [Trametopsis cervina]|nr:hypothetical protein BDW22DRAFT_1344788 [Trametopsis cervina]